MKRQTSATTRTASSSESDEDEQRRQAARSVCMLMPEARQEHHQRQLCRETRAEEHFDGRAGALHRQHLRRCRCQAIGFGSGLHPRTVPA